MSPTPLSSQQNNKKSSRLYTESGGGDSLKKLNDLIFTIKMTKQ